MSPPLSPWAPTGPHRQKGSVQLVDQRTASRAVAPAIARGAVSGRSLLGRQLAFHTFLGDSKGEESLFIPTLYKRSGCAWPLGLPVAKEPSMACRAGTKRSRSSNSPPAGLTHIHVPVFTQLTHRTGMNLPSMHKARPELFFICLFAWVFRDKVSLCRLS